MPSPKPPVDLSGQCSVIANNTLFTYSKDAFQQLPLRDNATWSELPMGVSVDGAACVKAVANGDESQTALYLVGGTANSSQSDYPGFQRYWISNRTWETIWPVTWVTQNRHNHGAVYLNSTGKILVYAGSQDPSDYGKSTQTFTLDTHSPYNAESYTNTQAPPARSPMLMQWDDSHAVYVGGDESNTRVFLFSPDEGWTDSGTNLTQGMNPSKVQCTLMTGDDGSKVLEQYDASVSPNVVNRTLLRQADGSPAAPGTTVGGPSSRKRKRDLTQSDWPSYNSSLAPKSTRTDYTVAESGDGVAVLSGGSTSDPVVMFNQRKNTWINETEFFRDQQEPLVASPTSPSSVLPTSTAASTPISSASSTSMPAPAAHQASDTKSRMLTVLGATLGAIFGLAAILIIILLLLRYKREKKKKANGGYINEKEDRLSFADRGAEFMHEAGGSVGDHYRNSLNHSSSSLAIMSGKAGFGNKSHKRGVGKFASTASTTGLIKKSPLAMNELLEMENLEDSPPRNNGQAVPRKAVPNPTQPPAAFLHPTHAKEMGVQRSRSSGWSRYFSNNETTNLAAMGGTRDTCGSDASDMSRSLYTDSRYHPSEHPSQTIGPLELNLGPKFEGLDAPQRFSRVATGSPTFGNSSENIGAAVSDGMAAELARHKSDASSVDSFTGVYGMGAYNKDGTASGILTGTTAWTPVSNPNWYDRPDSSVYSDSGAGANGPMRDTRVVSQAPTMMSTIVSSANGQYHHRPRVPSSHYTSVGAAPPLFSSEKNMSLFTSSPRVGHQHTDSGGSAVTVFPRGVPGSGVPYKPSVVDVKRPGPKPQQQDMSWIRI